MDKQEMLNLSKAEQVSEDTFKIQVGDKMFEYKVPDDEDVELVVEKINNWVNKGVDQWGGLYDYINRNFKLLTEVKESMVIETKFPLIDKYGLNGDDKFKYQMLSRLQSDCKYVTGEGNGNLKVLWVSGDPKTHCALMRELYNSVSEKPDWITLEDINNYEHDMVGIYEASDIKKMIQKGNTFIPVRKGEDEKKVLADYKKREEEANKEDEPPKQPRLRSPEMRAKLFDLFANHKDELMKMYDPSKIDPEKVKEKVQKGIGLTMNEYLWFINGPRPGDIVLTGSGTYKMASDGNYVLPDRWEAYEKDPEHNQDAIEPEDEGFTPEELEKAQKDIEKTIKDIGLTDEKARQIADELELSKEERKMMGLEESDESSEEIHVEESDGIITIKVGDYSCDFEPYSAANEEQFKLDIKDAVKNEMNQEDYAALLSVILKNLKPISNEIFATFLAAFTGASIEADVENTSEELASNEPEEGPEEPTEEPTEVPAEEPVKEESENLLEDADESDEEKEDPEAEDVEDVEKEEQKQLELQEFIDLAKELGLSVFEMTKKGEDDHQFKYLIGRVSPDNGQLEYITYGEEEDDVLPIPDEWDKVCEIKQLLNNVENNDKYLEYLRAAAKTIVELENKVTIEDVVQGE